MINQKKQLKEATKKRIKDIKDKEATMKSEIISLAKENKQLNFQGASLEKKVRRRKEISEMMSGGIGNLKKKKEKEKLEHERDKKKPFIERFREEKEAYKDIPGWKDAMYFILFLIFLGKLRRIIDCLIKLKDSLKNLKMLLRS